MPNIEGQGGSRNDNYGTNNAKQILKGWYCDVILQLNRKNQQEMPHRRNDTELFLAYLFTERFLAYLHTSPHIERNRNAII